MNSSTSNSDGRRLLAVFVGCLALSVAIYVVAFALIIRKPMTMGFVKYAWDVKTSYAAAVPSPKLIILAGSNALFSHSCAEIEKIISLKCVNAGITHGLGFRFYSKRAAEFIRPGDIVYMPLEYETYVQPVSDGNSSYAKDYILGYEPRHLNTLKFGALLSTLFNYDLNYFFTAATEMTLSGLGVKRRYNKNSLNKHGDLIGHDRSRSQTFEGYFVDLYRALPPLSLLSNARQESSDVYGFLDWARSQNVTIVGGLPTMFDHIDLSDQFVGHIRRIYTENGWEFLELQNRSQYPVSCFYDNPYHLHQECQIAHSRTLANALKDILSSVTSKK